MIPPVYENGRVRLWCGDSKKVLETFPSGCVHLVVTSPPYYVQRGRYSDLEEDIENAPTWEEYLQKLLDILTECARVLVAGGRMCINIADSWTNYKREKVNKCYPTHAYIIIHLEKLGMLYKGSFLYQQIRHSHSSGHASKLLGSYPYPPNIPILNCYEYILVFQKPGKYTPADPSPEAKEASKLTGKEFNLCATGIWHIPYNRDRSVCASPFPVELPRRLIRLFSRVGDIVLDPFVGSGVSVLEAALLGRRGWGIDINPLFIQHIIEKIKNNLFLAQ